MGIDSAYSHNNRDNNNIVNLNPEQGITHEWRDWYSISIIANMLPGNIIISLSYFVAEK